MSECVNYSRKWLCLGNKYFLSSTSTSTQYNKTESDCKHSDCFRYSNAPLIRLRHISRGAVAVRLWILLSGV